MKENLKLVTLDGDETLYPDRRNFNDNNTAHYLTTLLKSGVHIAVVTAAGQLLSLRCVKQQNVSLLHSIAF